MKPAIFLDRDGTIIEAVHYLADPAMVRLLPGAADALKRLRAAGYACVVVSNQSAIGRGLLTVDGLHEIHAEFCRQLAEEGAAIDGFYFCPTVPSSDDRTALDDPDRKPGPGMLLKAASDLGLDLALSWMVGDMVSDILAGHNAGCRGAIFVACGQGRAEDLERIDAIVLPDLAAAADHILSSDSTPTAAGAAPRSS
jgi:D-glycero-D-manno-heptose 1,7-bisphosphate phosphatase